ncbi:M23 family metallopeptidase [Kitasatospora sp. NPDC008050]|uniref:M23 family metallopeptidase n=1 Tax=Kitasatospora sp. NPDC008050 TaxID=3364021 RepID=UPI0036E147A8
MALSHSPESHTESGTTGLLDHPGAPADPARPKVPRQARAGAPSASLRLGGAPTMVTAMAAALGATGLSATAAAAATPAPAPAPALTVPDHGAQAQSDGAADPGLALAARIQQQADQRTAAEEAARLEAANEAAAKRAAQAEAAARAEAEHLAGQQRAGQQRAEQERAEQQQAARAQAAAAAQAEQEHAAAQAAAEQAKAAAEPIAARLPLAKYTVAASGSPWAALQTGLDFVAAVGTPVGAVSGGTVSSAGWSGAYGYRVVQTLPDGTELWYCHLASIAVTAGQVAPGTVLGTVGATGAAPSLRPGAAPIGPHLRLEVRPGGGAPVDPAAWLAAHGATVRAVTV